MLICITRLTTIGSDNGLSPGQHQAIIWTNAGILLIGALGTNVSEILIKICTFSFKKMLLKMSCGKRRPSCIGLNVLTHWGWVTHMHHETNHYWFIQWLVAWSAPSHYPNQCWDIVNWTPRNKLQWNFNRNTKLYIHENAFVWEMAAILFRGETC